MNLHQSTGNSLPKIITNREKKQNTQNHYSYHNKYNKQFSPKGIKQQYNMPRFTVNIPSVHQQNSLKILSPFYNRNHHKSPQKCQCYVHRLKRIKMVQQCKIQQKCQNSRFSQMKQYQDKIVHLLKGQHNQNKKIIALKQNEIIQLNVQKANRIKQQYYVYVNKKQINQKHKIQAINQINNAEKTQIQYKLKERLDKMYSLDNRNVPFQEILLKRSMDNNQKKYFVKKVIGFLNWKSSNDSGFVKDSKTFIQNYLKSICKKIDIQEIIQLTNSQNKDYMKMQTISKIMNTTVQKTSQVLSDLQVVLEELRKLQQENRKFQQLKRQQQIMKLEGHEAEGLLQVSNQNQNTHSQFGNFHNFSNQSKRASQNISQKRQSIISESMKSSFLNQSILKQTKKSNQETKYMKSSNNSKNNSAKNKAKKQQKNKNNKQTINQNENQQTSAQVVQKPPFFQDWMRPKQVKKKQINQKYKNIKYQDYCTKQTFQKLALQIDEIQETQAKTTMLYEELALKKILFQQQIIEDLIGEFSPMFNEESVKLFRQMVIKNRTKKLMQKLNKQIDEGINKLKRQKTQYEQQYIEDFQIAPKKQTVQSNIESTTSRNSVLNKNVRNMHSVSRILRISTQIITQQIEIISQKDIDNSICQVKQQINYYSRVVHEDNKENVKERNTFHLKKITPEVSQKQKQVLLYMKKKHHKMFDKLSEGFSNLSKSLIQKA